MIKTPAVVITVTLRAIYKPATRFHFFPALLCIVLAGCNGQSMAVSKDLNTGMVTTSRGLHMKTARMLMNGKVLNHTDIPLGESFLVANDGIMA